MTVTDRAPAAAPPAAAPPIAGVRGGSDDLTDMLISGPTEVHTRPWQQLTTLAERGVGKVIRNGELIFAFVAPAFLAACFYLPLSSIMNRYPGVSYGQFLMPIIVLQSVGFSASSAAMRSALDGAEGINTRFRVLPMPAAVPMLARLVTSAFLLSVSLACAAIAALAIGWRPQGGVWGTVGVFGIAFVVGAAFALLADGIGLAAGSPEATSQTMALPTLILGMLSTGFVPAWMFPSWIRGFVRNQPISQFVDSMRAMDTGTATWRVMAPTVWWCLGLTLVAAVLVFWGSGKIRR